MIDFRDMDRDQQLVVEKSLMTQGLLGIVEDELHAGNICAICLQYKCNCADEPTEG